MNSSQTGTGAYGDYATPVSFEEGTVASRVGVGGRAVAEGIGAYIATVDEDSPAQRAGLKPGRVICEVDGQALRDSIDWLWFTDKDTIHLLFADGQTLTIARNFGEPWGISFVDPLFDGIMTCRNNCLFCFMSMLPKGMRPSLYLRDDDYRLSFLQGNFVTLTNMRDEDIQRIIMQRISPLHVSLHAVTPKVRHHLIGKNHARGLEALEELLRAGIEFHAQIVLVPGINDGKELDATLQWVETRPNIRSVGIVPYGYTRYAKLQKSFSCNEAKALITQLLPYQKRARANTGFTRFQLADEWYLKAREALPAAHYYDDFPQYEDGIGMVRSFIDDWHAEAKHLKHSSVPDNVYLVTGEAFAPILTKLAEPLPLTIIPIKNNFFGGNVNVAGLLTAQDIIEQVNKLDLPLTATIFIPSAIGNVDGLTLDNASREDIAHDLQRQVSMVPCSAISFFEALNKYFG